MAWEDNIARSMGIPIVPVKAPPTTPGVPKPRYADTPPHLSPQKNIPRSDIPRLPKIPKPTEPVDQSKGIPSIPKATDAPGQFRDDDNNGDYEEMNTMAQFSNDHVLKLVEAYVAGPIAPRPEAPNLIDVEHLRREEVKKREDHGQGDVKSKDDGRLKENRDKKHKELTDQAVALEEQAGEPEGGARHEESEEGGGDEEHVQEPYERARVDHRASATDPGTTLNDPRGVPTGLPKLPSPAEVAPKLRTDVGPLGKGLTLRSPMPAPGGFSPEEHALRTHPQFGPYVTKALGPNPADQMTLQKMRSKIKNLMGTASADEREELIRFASLVAEAILKQM